jgi:hypothetical protein
MPVPDSAFREGDVYIDYPQEEMFFRFDRKTGAVFRKLYGESVEAEVPTSFELFAEARRIGEEIDAERYHRGAPRRY